MIRMPLMPQVPVNLRLSDTDLQKMVGSIVAGLTQAHNDWHITATALIEEQFERWCVCSPFLFEHAQRRPEIIADALSWPLAQPRLPNAMPVAVVEAMVNRHLDHDLGEDALMQALRRFRHVEMIRLVIGELSGRVPVSQTLQLTTELADACISGATRFAHALQSRRYGEPLDTSGKPQQLVVLAMGKLGGGELNFSSDVDLICAYRAAGQTHDQAGGELAARSAENLNGENSGESIEGQVTAKRSIDNEEFFRRVIQTMAKIVGKITEDGFVFRVDLRLRPFGDSGPLVMNFDGLEQYYLTQGREWERYAMIKSRAVCGLPEDRAELESLLKPFVYRRYLDYGAYESLRELKKRIAAQVRQKGMEQNIKLGPGGIREIEFIGQAFQLVRGGRELLLQQRPIMDVLNALETLALMDIDDIDLLRAAYYFLRRTENSLQMMRDQQVHTLPVDESDQERVAYALEFTDWESFERELTGHRDAVQRIFQQLFQSDDDAVDTDVDPMTALWLSVGENPDLAQALLDHGFENNEQAAQVLSEFVDSVFFRNLTTQALRRVELLMPKILQAVQAYSGSWRAMQGLLLLVRSVAGRSVYLQVLIETPDALRLITRLFSRSSFVAEFICQHPIVIDELLDYRHIESPPDRKQMHSDMQFVLQRVRHEDLDVQMDAIRQFKQANMMRVAAAELEDQLDLMRVSDHLSWIAELTLEAVLELVWAEMVERYGEPQCEIDQVTRTPGFAIVGYGKLGGVELGYSSDLDLVFLHESEGSAQVTNGKRSIENQVFFARLAQKIVHFISTLTPAGTLYEVDTRLRPNGRSGMLVSALAGFENYHQHDAWTWEHQALVRARVVVGNARIRRLFATIRAEVLCRQRDTQLLRQEVAQMRARMRSELGGTTGTFDLKQDLGGIADIEFMVQYMVLWNASVYQELTLDTDNYRILERIEKLGFVPPETASDLRDAYLDFRRIVHRFALLERSATIPLNQDSTGSEAASGVVDAQALQQTLKHREQVTRYWQQLMEPDSPTREGDAPE